VFIGIFTCDLSLIIELSEDKFITTHQDNPSDTYTASKIFKLTR